MCARLSAQMRVFHNSAGVRLGKIENSESGRVAAWQEAPCASAWPTRKNSANGENGKRRRRAAELQSGQPLYRRGADIQ